MPTKPESVSKPAQWVATWTSSTQLLRGDELPFLL